jgi:hypothetical protein
MIDNRIVIRKEDFIKVYGMFQVYCINGKIPCEMILNCLLLFLIEGMKSIQHQLKIFLNGHLQVHMIYIDIYKDLQIWKFYHFMCICLPRILVYRLD